MKTARKKLLAVLLMLTVMVLATGTTAFAAKVQIRRIGIAKNLVKKQYVIGGPQMKFSKIKVSNPKILSTDVVTEDGYNWLVFRAKKSGTTEVTCKIKNKNKVRSFRFVVTVFQYENPFRRFLIGSANYKKHFRDTNRYSGAKAGVSGKLDIETKPEWAVVEVKLETPGKNTTTEKLVKNHKKVTLKQNGSLQITLQNQKLGFIYRVALQTKWVA